MGIKLSKDVVLDKLKAVFPNYTFDMSLYNDTHSKIMVTCPDHGNSYKIVKNLLKGHGCLVCGNKSSSDKQRASISNLIEVFNKKHDHKYDYSKFVYRNNRTPGIIICPEHGEFSQNSRTHSLGHGCPSCSSNKRLTNDEFIEKSRAIHMDKYTYNNTVYKNMHSKVEIECEKHGPFYQLPLHHIRGVGCPTCNQSKGEIMIENFLKEKNINYIKQKKFNDCVYKNKLVFDFYLPDYKTCIEFNGIQHYYSLDIFGGEDALVLNRIRDDIKRNFCSENELKLIIIKQDKKHINIKDINSQIDNIPNIINESNILDFTSYVKRRFL